MVFVKLAIKANSKGVHRTLNRPPKGKGWVPCANGPAGLFCRPDALRESIEHYRKAYSIFPDIVALYQIALAHEMLGEAPLAREHFRLVAAQAANEGNAAYAQAARIGLGRLDSPT
jgi:tetratricopeptide (TPR) repeat protein